MFFKLTTQWVYAGMSGELVGLNYQSMEFLFKIYCVEDPRQMLEDIRMIEAGALDFIRENKKG